MLLLQKLIVASLGLFIVVGAQRPQATCTDPAFQWSFNSQGQGPCQIAAALAAPCYGGQFDVPSITPTQHYNGPTLQSASDCRCNTVFYSLISACAACQGADLTQWSGFAFNCTQVYPMIYPQQPAVPVPAYAYLDVITPDTFNATAASAFAASGAPESTRTPQSTGDTISQAAPTVSFAPNTTPESNSDASKPNVGAIAGGTVGGVVGLALVGGLIWWLLRRERRKQNQHVQNTENILGEPKNHSFYTNSEAPYPGHGFSGHGSPSLHTDGDATFGSSYGGRDLGQFSARPGHLERRPSSPEI